MEPAANDIPVNRLHALAEKAGISQGEIARRLGMHKIVVNKHFNRKRKISKRDAMRYAKVLDTTVLEIFHDPAA